MSVDLVPVGGIPGLSLVRRRVHADARGDFRELWRAAPDEPWPAFRQENLSRSRRGVLRGLHAQSPRPQGKLVTVVDGRVYDVVVDLRRGSPAFKSWTGVWLTADEGVSLYVPPGCAHGFLVTSATATFLYCCTDTYDPASEFAVAWNDPTLRIIWPLSEAGVAQPDLSPKDASAPLLATIPETRFIAYTGGTP